MIIIRELVFVPILLGIVSRLPSVESRDWAPLIEFAQNFFETQEQTEPNLVYHQLMELRNDLADTHRVPKRTESRDLVIAVLSLANAVDLTNEKCYQPAKPIIEDNHHRANYLEIERTLNKSGLLNQNMLNFVKNYTEVQHFICKTQLIVQFGMIWKRKIASEPFVEQFKKLLVESFPKTIKMNSANKIRGIGRVLTGFYTKAQLSQTAGSAAIYIQNYYSGFNHFCSTHFLDPLKTLMMTYDREGRRRPKLEALHGDVVRAYDLCLFLRSSISQIELNQLDFILRKWVQQVVAPEPNSGQNLQSILRIEGESTRGRQNNQPGSSEMNGAKLETQSRPTVDLGPQDVQQPDERPGYDAHADPDLNL